MHGDAITDREKRVLREASDPNGPSLACSERRVADGPRKDHWCQLGFAESIEPTVGAHPHVSLAVLEQCGRNRAARQGHSGDGERLTRSALKATVRSHCEWHA